VCVCVCVCVCVHHVCTDVRSAAKAKRKLKQLQAAKPQHSVEELLCKVWYAPYSRSGTGELVVCVVCLALSVLG